MGIEHKNIYLLSTDELRAYAADLEAENMIIKMSNSQIISLLKDTQDDCIRERKAVRRLEAEGKTAKKCNLCMSKQIDKLTNDPLSCNPSEDGTCDQDCRDSKETD